MNRTQLVRFLATSALVVGSMPVAAQDTWNATWDWRAPCDPTTCTVSGASGELTATIAAWGALEDCPATSPLRLSTPAPAISA